VVVCIEFMSQLGNSRTRLKFVHAAKMNEESVGCAHILVEDSYGHFE
jgi:hypothetical protein